MKPVPHGEPYAGKLHVRFDEGAGVPHGASRSTLHPCVPDGFVQLIEGELGNRFGLVVNREKAKLLDMEADKSALSFLGYEFRYVRGRHYMTGKRYLEWCPSPKSVKAVSEKSRKSRCGANCFCP